LRRAPFALSFAPMPDPLPNLSPAELARYSRQVLLDAIGVEGQRRLSAARVLVVGAGGLGSPAALYLAAAGVGTVGVADFDRVAAHNLPRQLLHDDAAVGQPKVVSAARRLRATNPFIRAIEHGDGITPGNALEVFSGYDVIVDATDNFGARYLNNDAAFFAHKPLIYGSVFKFEGQVAVFDPARGGPCYRCLFPTPPAAGTVPGCGEAGVLGASCGVIGSLQALEAIKLVAGFGEPLRGQLLNYDGLATSFQILALPRDPHCPLCGSTPSIHNLAAGTATCAPHHRATDEPAECPLELSVTEARHLLLSAPETTMLIDVREPYEMEICRLAGTQHIPLRQIPERLDSLPRDRHILILCHSGGRSLRVTEFLRASGFPAVSNVAGGIDAWAKEIDPAMRRY
jgi:sulfur-carrier protein adenylyltransferase/sulfurtransferase